MSLVLPIFLGRSSYAFCCSTFQHTFAIAVAETTTRVALIIIVFLPFTTSIMSTTTKNNSSAAADGGTAKVGTYE